MKKTLANAPLFVIYFFSITLQAYTLNEAKKMCEEHQGKEAIKIYTSLSDNGDDNATEELKKIFGWGGCGINHNYKKLNYYLERLAKKGNIKAADSLAAQYMIGSGVEKNLKKAEYWLSKYRVTSNAKNQYDIAQKFTSFGIYDKALKWYLMSAKQNYIESFYWIGVTYRHGSGSTLKNPKTALFWWEKGAKLGDLLCMEKTADLYRYPFNNEKKYLYWLEKAANKKSNYQTQYQYRLGWYYFYNESKYTDRKKAAYWIEQAHKHGSKDAKIFWDKYELWKYK